MATWRVTPTCLVDGQSCQNVLHFTSDDAQTAITVADVIAQHWLPQMLPFQHTGAVWVAIQARQIHPASLAPFTKTVVMAGSGDTEREADNPCLSRKIWLRSNIAGKHGRGRFYIPGTTQASWAMGRIKTASLQAGATLLSTLMTKFTTAQATSGLRLVIQSRSDASSHVDVVVLEQAPILGVQRRRNIGVGI